MKLKESKLYNEFREELMKEHVDDNFVLCNTKSLNGCNLMAAVDKCISSLFNSRKNGNYLFEEYILLKLNTVSMPFGYNKGDAAFSKMLEYVKLFFDSFLTCFAAIIVSSEIINQSNTESIVNSMIIYALSCVLINIFLTAVKYILNAWKKDCTRVIFTTVLQESFAIIIGEMITKKEIRKMKDAEQQEFTEWALKIIFNKNEKKEDKIK